mmetsp:Transcript_36263/g.95386  ORF Transcript_36263/g.95386 Transcript_36263/m.95386 type:complete len:92 (+) Transcript_36263:236-511(+)
MPVSADCTLSAHGIHLPNSMVSDDAGTLRPDEEPRVVQEERSLSPRELDEMPELFGTTMYLSPEGCCLTEKRSSKFGSSSRPLSEADDSLI